MNQGKFLKTLVANEKPVQVAGVINAYTALLAKAAGIKALYISGGATAANLGLPDLGVLNADDFLTVIKQITAVVDLPILVDADTGFGNELAIKRTVQLYEQAGAAGLHIEDQVADKRCGHREGKVLCSQDEMNLRIQAACSARSNIDFVIMARTDAIAIEGIEQAIIRAKSYIDSGADMIFLEGATEINHYEVTCKELSVPVLANMTEFGVSPILSKDDLNNAGVALILYPLTAFRAMMKTAKDVYAELVQSGDQQNIISKMQSRQELYETINYFEQEQNIDQQISGDK